MMGGVQIELAGSCSSQSFGLASWKVELRIAAVLNDVRWILAFESSLMKRHVGNSMLGEN
jgi:hypothetical protein